MDREQYEKARKTVQATKRKENFLLVKLEYNKHLVLPHKAGLAFIEALGEAELLQTGYQEPHRIQGLARDTFEITHLSVEEYERYKIAALLNVSIEDLKQFEQAPEPA